MSASSPARPGTARPTRRRRSTGSVSGASPNVAHGRLSQGQRRRLSLANAIARKPRLLLLDEPHAGLDERGREVLEAVVRDAPAAGCTVLLASHELDLARRLATREVRIVAGQVQPAPPSGPAAESGPTAAAVATGIESPA